MLQKQATPAMRATVTELITVRARKKESEAREAELVTSIKEYVENQPGAIKDNATLLALVEEKSRTGIDATLLKTKFPAAAAACEKTNVFLTVKCC
jgi:hypothetical protein